MNTFHLTNIINNATTLRDHELAPEHQEPGQPQRLSAAALAKVKAQLALDMDAIRPELDPS